MNNNDCLKLLYYFCDMIILKNTLNRCILKKNRLEKKYFNKYKKGDIINEKNRTLCH